MLSPAQVDDLIQPTAEARAFLYLDDATGEWEIMPPEGGRFEVLHSEDPLIFPLAGGPATGRRMSQAGR